MSDYPKAVTKVEIGTASDVNVDLIAVEYAGDRPMGSGPGGDHLSPLTVPNTVLPIGIVGHHKWWEIIVGLSEDEYTAFYNTNVSGTDKAIVMNDENTAIGYFAITQKSGAGTTRTITYETAKTYVAGVSQNKVTNEEGKYVVEVKLVCIGTRTVPAWA
jgi:hypothetical protein